MASSPQPYKSRLFNHLNRRRILWGDRASQMVRSLKVGVIWSIQILLYPFYVLAQTGRAIAGKLEQVFSPPALPHATSTSDNPHPSTDLPIQHTLKALSPWVEQESGLMVQQPHFSPLWTASDNETKITVIQGVASCLDSRKLVLITGENQPCDLLTPEQQHQLQQRILWEISDYAYQQHQLRIREQRFLIPDNLAQNKKILPPLRWFWHTMRWLQQSPVAVTTNLFGEADLIPVVSPTLPYLPERSNIDFSTLPPTGALYQLDAALAQLEQRQQTLSETVQDWLTPTPEEVPQTLNFRLKSMVRSSFNAFLGVSDMTMVSSPPDTVSSENNHDPWLVWEDLYDNTEAVNASLPHSPSEVDEELYIELQHLSSSPGDSTLEMRNPATMATSSQGGDPHYTPDWIETESQPLGYVQHPLEKVLNFFDEVVSKIEMAIAQLWDILIKRMIGK
ncbi:hypothetical protein PN462_20705 [Spirulina sp. CS-785/01]|uniref:hypothetical protein n=1 Tax=Spirulina sp. CS-785/01 TaxID=3021716 RepID=UPI00232E18BD|nr:hypothetical protein [Spirulina sp. CS-785/01]MDB9315547.1 hypothetical protein [Spirulina sp. CS-785/01]